MGKAIGLVFPASFRQWNGPRSPTATAAAGTKLFAFRRKVLHERAAAGTKLPRSG